MTKQAAVAAPIATQSAIVVSLLSDATSAANTLSEKARQAAIEADHLDFTDLEPTKRLDAILTLYMPLLGNQTVKYAFSASLAILIADKPVVIQSSAVTTKADGSLSFAAPEVVAIGAVKPDDKSETTLTPADAINKLGDKVLKQAATVAREALGRARKEGGGRKAAPAAPARAPFFDEVVAVLKDATLRAQLFDLMLREGWRVEANTKEVRRSRGKGAQAEPTMAQQLHA